MDYPHLLLRNSAESESYTPSGSWSSRDLKSRNRGSHGEKLKNDLEESAERDKVRKENAPENMNVGDGIYIKFESDPGYELNIDSLERTRQGIEVTAVRNIEVDLDEGTAEKQVATVFIPEGKLEHFFGLIEKYLEEETSSGDPRHRKLIDTIARIRLATLRAFWTEPSSDFPDPSEQIWWEAWLRVGKNGEEREDILNRFRDQAENAELRTTDNSLFFPENTVVLIQGSPEELSESVLLLDCLSELRRAKTAAGFFLDLPPSEQEEAIEEALERTTFPEEDAPAVCLLDTGVNRGHPLLEDAIAAEDMEAYNPEWGTTDDRGHGTLMAGLSLYGDLAGVLQSASPINLSHRIESVKILPPQGSNDPQLYGDITQESIARAEVNAPNRPRVICLATTAKHSRDQGRPSSWSGAVDQSAYGSGPSADDKRLIVVSSGNTELEAPEDFPQQNLTEGIHDPAQAWNALTVGSYTDKIWVDRDEYPDWEPLSQRGGLGPTSTTSLVWENQWPIKPDIVMEGGNMSVDGAGAVLDGPPSLRLVTTNDRFRQRSPLVQMGDTSASTALASNLCAQIIESYPDLWIETVRGLVIHSADWSPQMLREATDDAAGPDPWEMTSNQKENLMRRYGHGIPNLEVALENAQNALTLVSEDSLQPFDRTEDSRLTTNDLNLHQLPWPRDVLQNLGGTIATMRVTLSYFIEPNPGRKGYQNRRSYTSCGLRFKVKSPTETTQEFRAKVNKEARDETERDIDGQRDYESWMLGPQLRTKGSVHVDTWRGPAAELAEKEVMAVYPVGGWWRYRSHLEKWQNNIRYSLIVSIETEETETDIYTPVAVAQPIRIP